MTYLSDTAVSKMQELSWQLGGCHTQHELETSALQWLFDHVPCSHAAYTDYPAFAAPTQVRIVPEDVDSAAVETSVLQHFAEEPVSDHPLVAHYFYQWNAITPLRMSDLLSDRQLRSTRVYSQVFQPVGVTHQIAIVNRRVSQVDNAGYAIMRQNQDFTDAELDLAIALQPMLYALHQAIGVRHPTGGAAASEPLRLTPAELEILSLVAAGLTAVAIGHLRRVSPRTVRKHLENIYGKLGYHDRLQAVTYARSIGLISDGLASDAVSE